MIKIPLLVLVGFASGVVVAAGTFAFIAAIGIVPRMAQRTNTKQYIPLYEDIILLGGLFGCLISCMEWKLGLQGIPALLHALLCGIFVGVLAMALAEVLNVMPILMRRARLKKGITWFVVSFALGKVIGSLLYFFQEGFYQLP